MAVPVYADAEAERTRIHAVEGMEPVTVLTTQRCSIWSAPATAEENRVKYVDEGYQITVYPEVIQSGSGDGKTFYRTVKGAYVLCKCVTGAENGVTAGGSGYELIFPTMPVPPSLDRSGVRSERHELLSGGAYDMVLTAIHINDYDVFGNVIKTAVYSPDGTLSCVEVMEYDASGNMVKYANYDPNGSIRGVRVSEYDASGNKIRDISYDPTNGSVEAEYIWAYDASGNMVREVKYYDGAVQTNDGYEYDAQGNKIKFINYRADGTLNYCVIYEYDALGNKRKWTRYDADGNMEEIRTFHADGGPDQWGLVRPDGSIYWVE